MPKCIAIVDDGKKGKRCPDNAQSSAKEWPKSSLCPGHWTALKNSDVKKGDGGKGFDTIYKYDGEDVGLCRDESRKSVKVEKTGEYVSEYYFCNPSKSDVDSKLDECRLDIPSSPRSPASSPRPGSPRPLSVAYGASLSPITSSRGGRVYTCRTPENLINKFKNEYKEKKEESESSSESETESSSESEAEEEVEDMEFSKSKKKSYSLFRSRLPPELAGEITDKEPKLIDNVLKSNSKILMSIDTTRDVKLALQHIKTIQKNIATAGELQDDKYINQKYSYIVSETVVNKVAKKLGKYMDNPDRIELVLIFLFDYESRDLFEQMKFYGFSYEGERKERTTVANLLEKTPYEILNIPTTGSGGIAADIARPREISDIFDDKIKRIKAVRISTETTQQQQQRGKTPSPAEQAAATAATNPADGRPQGQQIGSGALPSAPTSLKDSPTFKDIIDYIPTISGIATKGIKINGKSLVFTTKNSKVIFDSNPKQDPKLSLINAFKNKFGDKYNKYNFDKNTVQKFINNLTIGTVKEFNQDALNKLVNDIKINLNGKLNRDNFYELLPGDDKFKYNNNNLTSDGFKNTIDWKDADKDKLIAADGFTTFFNSIFGNGNVQGTDVDALKNYITTELAKST